MFQRPSERLSWVPVTRRWPLSSETTTQLCEFCDHEFGEAELPVHQRISHKNKIKEQILKHENSFCGTCVKTFSNKEELLKHTLTFHLYSSESALRIEHEIFACDHCQQIFFTKLALQNHIIFSHMKKNVAKGNKLIKCHFCKKSIPMRYYWVHASKHAHLNHMVYCFKCDSKFKNQATFKEHFRSHSKHYYCDICKYSSEKELTFTLHIKSHRNAVTLPSNEENIERYYISKHITDLWKMRKSIFFSGVWLPKDFHICVFCREICYSKSEMRLHIQSHKPLEPKKVYSCECGEEYTNKILLKQHKFQFKGSHTRDDAKQALETKKLVNLAQPRKEINLENTTSNILDPLKNETVKNPVSISNEAVENPVSISNEAVENPVSISNETVENPVSISNETVENPVSISNETVENPVSISNETVENPDSDENQIKIELINDATISEKDLIIPLENVNYDFENDSTLNILDDRVVVFVVTETSTD